MRKYQVPTGRCLKCGDSVADTRVVVHDDNREERTYFGCRTCRQPTQTFVYDRPYGPEQKVLEIRRGM